MAKRSVVLAHLCLSYFLLLITLTSSHVLGQADDAGSSRPNILVFIMDDVGMGDLGCFGNTTVSTPNIDQLAREGAKLTQHIVHPICTPSRAALMTGRYAIRSGLASPHIMRVISFISAPAGLPSNETTIAEVVRDVGYSTALVGKWHLGYTCDEHNNCSDPNSQGFDYFYGLPLTNLLDCGHGTVFEMWRKNFYNEVAYILIVLTVSTLVLVLYRILPQRSLTVVVTLSVSFYIFCLLIPRMVATMNCVVMENREVVEQPLSYTNLTQRHTQRALDFLEHKKDGPFLLVMSFIQAHTDLYAEGRFQNQSQNGRYGAAVEELDWSVGEIMGALHRLGLDKNTFTYLTSDNGAHIEEFSKAGEREGGSNGIYRGGKANCYEGGVRVPTIVRYPGVVPAGSEVPEATSNVDLLPTIAGLTGGEVPTDRIIDGKDMLPLLRGTEAVSPHEFMFQYCGTYLHGARYRPRDGKSTFKITYTSPKLVEGPHGTIGCFEGYPCRCAGPMTIKHDPPLIYDLTSDPSETTPLDPKSPDVQEILAKAKSAVSDHKRALLPVQNQFDFMRLMPRFRDQPCCGTFPFCKCTENHATEFTYDGVQPDLPNKDWGTKGHAGTS